MPNGNSAIIFVRTKHGADRVARILVRAGFATEAIHGDKRQNIRQRALGDFKSGRVRVLVATDIAARGIDVSGVSHVVNYDMPLDAETYVHRVGRTGRAGAAGTALSLCAPEERRLLAAVERLIGKRVPVLDLGMVAAGFVLRTVAGAVAVDVPISVWFYIVASFGSLFVVAGKRHSEMVELGAAGEQVRSTLGAYTDSYLAYVRSVATGVTFVAYCLWAFEKSNGVGGFPWFEVSIVPFVLAVMRYAFIVDRGEAGAPEDVVLTDRMLQAFGLVWVVTVGIGILLGH